MKARKMKTSKGRMDKKERDKRNKRSLFSPGGEATRMTTVMMVTIDCNLICPATLPHSVLTISS